MSDLYTQLEEILDDSMKALFYETEGVYPWDKAEPHIKKAVAKLKKLIEDTDTIYQLKGKTGRTCREAHPNNPAEHGGH